MMHVHDGVQVIHIHVHSKNVCWPCDGMQTVLVWCVDIAGIVCGHWYMYGVLT